MIQAALLVTLFSQNPIPGIDGPSEVDAGSKIVLTTDLRGSWDLGAVPEDRYFVSPNSDIVCIWASRPERIRVVLTVAECADGEPIEYAKFVHMIVVGNAPPGPNPGPEPLPDGKYGLAAKVIELAAVVKSERGRGAELAKSYRAIASQIAAGTLKDVDTIIADTTEMNRETLGDAREAWLPFFQELGAVLFELNESGELTTAEDHTVAWMEIAVGLERVK